MNVPLAEFARIPEDELLEKARAYRDAIVAVGRAFAAVKGAADSQERAAARSAWLCAEEAMTDAQRTAAFALAYRMLGIDWYATLLDGSSGEVPQIATHLPAAELLEVST